MFMPLFNEEIMAKGNDQMSPWQNCQNYCAHLHKNLSLDIDECLKESSHECDLNATCINTPGSYTCLCRNGYTGDGKTCAGT